MAGGGGRARAILLSGVAFAAAAMPVAGVSARERGSVAITAQPLGAALQELARQTGVNILFLPETVRGLRAPPVSGRVDAEQAARALVGDSGLTVVKDGVGGLIVRPAPPRAAPPPPVVARAGPPEVRGSALPPPPVLAPEVSRLEELVVTATRRTDTVNRIPLSITAETQRGLDERGLRTIQDLQATTPSMRITSALGGGAAILAIRGIVQVGPTAATTGFYLDDTPLQRRSVSGTPLPLLFDLDRVEVLRGPQGTLFGGGSEGGTIRLIQPQPSLSAYSTYAKAQVSTVHHGSASYELGAAVGGPIVPDRLGFRASAFRRRNSGYIDLVDPFTGRVWNENANSAEQQSLRLAIAWAPFENVRTTLSYVTARTENDHAADRMTLPIREPIQVPTLCYDTRGIELLPITSTMRTTPLPIGRGAAECAAAAAAGRVTYQTPAYTLGPYPLKPYEGIENDVVHTKGDFRLYSWDVSVAARGFDAKSITSYVEDTPKSTSPQPFQVNRVVLAANLDPNDPRNARVGQVVIPSGIPFIPFLGPEGFKGPAHFHNDNPRYSFSQELRLSSRADARPVTWVAGLFYSNVRIKANTTFISESNAYSLAQFGITDVQRYGVRSLESAPGIYNVFARVRQTLKDEEAAAFGEINYWLSDRLSLIAGLRLSQVRFDYKYAEVGPSIGVTVPTVANGGAFSGSVKETPLTPRLGVQYVFGPASTVYASASKGYRAGGLNTPVPQAQAGDSLARNFGAGFTVFNLPRTYASDSVWSYEVGAKVRLFHRLQLNGAAYVIDWRDPQNSTLIPQSGAIVTTNSGGARSIGLELEGQAVLPGGLSLIGALGLNKTQFTRRAVAFTGFNGVDAVSALDGQDIAGPPATLSLGARKDFRVSTTTRAYVRGDWRYTAGFDNAPFGATTWNPDSNHYPAISVANLRAGVEVGGLDVNLFVNNLFEPHKGQVSGGRTGCLLPAAGGTPACTSYSAYEAFRQTSWGSPREFGLQIAFRR